MSLSMPSVSDRKSFPEVRDEGYELRLVRPRRSSFHIEKYAKPISGAASNRLLGSRAFPM